MKKIFLIDGYTLVFRAYYAFIKNPRINSKGINTSAIFGFTNSLDEIIRKENPSHMAVVFDFPAPNFRHGLYPQYKANRQPTPEDIKKSMPLIKEIIKGFNIPVIEMQGFEADDLIGTLAKKAESVGFDVFMATSDKDFGQLVSDKVFIYKPKKFGNENEVVGAKEICAKYSIKNPSQVIDILAVWGDQVDNVPGIPGVGEKTAIQLISRYESVENLYRNLSSLTGKLKENVAKSFEQIKLSKILVTIKTDIEIDFIEDDYKIKDYNKDVLNKLFNDLEFTTLGSRILQQKTQQVQQATLFEQAKPIEVPDLTFEKTLLDISNVHHEYHLIDSIAGCEELVSILLKQKEVSFDTETTSLDTISAELVGLSFCFEKYKAYYVVVPVDKDLALRMVSIFTPFFENSQILKIGQNCKFDILMLKNYGIQVHGELFDTMIAHYLVYPELRHNLDSLAENYLSYKMVSIEELIGKKGKDQGNMRDVPKEIIKDYAAEDADITFQLKELLYNELVNHDLLTLAQQIEMPLIHVLADMEFTGVSIDSNQLNSYGSELALIIADKEKEIINMAGVSFNVASPKQLGEVLFEKMKIIDDPKMTKTKQYATGEPELVKIKDKHPIIPIILEYRSLQKLLGTYVEALPKLVHSKTGKIHTSFNQAIASTGRLSSNNPNLQNIPIRTEEGKQIRKSFIASGSDFILLDADYSQIELRIMAHLSKDENMRIAFLQGEDIHAATAAKIYNIPKLDVSKEMRSRAKSANFGIIYGISSFGLAENLKISRKEAKELIDGYFKTYPDVKNYMDSSIRNAREKGYVQTISGRRRYLTDINSQNAMVKGIAERNAINAPIQGAAADIIKIAMIKIFNALRKKGFKSKMIIQVHDELLLDVYLPELNDVIELVKNEMENAIKLDVPLIVEYGTAQNWLAAH